MSLMDQMKDVFLTLFARMRRTLRLQYLLRVTRSIKSSSLTKQTIPLPTYNSFSERLLRSSRKTVDLSLLATTRIRLLNPFIQGVQLLSSLLEKEIDRL